MRSSPVTARIGRGTELIIVDDQQEDYKMTKEKFIQSYQDSLIQIPQEWVSDNEKVSKFMTAVRNTLYSLPGQKWFLDRTVTYQAWRDIGRRGTPTLKKLKALPDA